MYRLSFKIKTLTLALMLAACVVGCDKIGQIIPTAEKKETPKQAENTNTKQDIAIAANEVVRIKDWALTVEQFNERLIALKEAIPDYDINDVESKKLILEELIRQQLLVVDAEKTGVAQDSNIVAAVNEFRKTLIVREMASKLVANIEVTDEEAKDFYEENKAALVTPAELRVREIVFETQETANVVLIELLKGADFVEMAKQHSISESAKNGGDLGFINEVPFPQMANALVNLEVGDVSNVFKGSDGFYVVKLEEKRGGEPLVFEDIKNDIIQNRTRVKQQQAIIDYLDRLRQETTVQVNESLLK